jgi:hypothetical protein
VIFHLRVSLPPSLDSRLSTITSFPTTGARGRITLVPGINLIVCFPLFSCVFPSLSTHLSSSCGHGIAIHLVPFSTSLASRLLSPHLVLYRSNLSHHTRNACAPRVTGSCTCRTRCSCRPDAVVAAPCAHCPRTIFSFALPFTIATTGRAATVHGPQRLSALKDLTPST